MIFFAAKTAFFPEPNRGWSSVAFHKKRKAVTLPENPHTFNHAGNDHDTATMTRHEFISALASAGVRVHRGHVDDAVRSGALPVTMDRGWRVFTPESVERMKSYWSGVPVGRSRKHHHDQGTTSGSR